MNIQSKIEVINNTFKSHRVNDSFMVMKDKDGWTDGYMAYFREDIKYQKALLQAKEKDAKHKMQRFVLEKENAPSVARIIGTGPDYKTIDDIQLSICEIGCAVDLIVTKTEKQEAITARINPSFLVYFGDSELTLKIKNQVNPVQVYKNDELIGLIMPIRIN